MTENFNRLVTLLRELFQMDRPDLDFGIYRIMNQKRKDVSAFLENDLLPQVRKELSTVNSGGNVLAELNATIKQARELGADPEQLSKVQKLREQLAAYGDSTAAENEIYSHLYNFFRRYYKDGDFLSLRRYKKDVYAIPYEGEEVKLHWANADQYYIKSAENFRDYAFLVGETPTEGQEDARKRVHFKLVEADTEVANNKAQEGKERRFMLCDDSPMLEENGELIIRFEYKPTAKKQNQKSLNEAAVKTILGNAAFVGWVRLLAQEDNGRSLLEKHLNIYTARNTFDFFIHKDLGGFLRRELDFYIKNEVLFLDDIENQASAHVETQLTQIRVLRRIAHKIIRFLEQIENFQKKLWLKKKFVVETNYLITLDRMPEELYPEIAANDAQREEWVRLFAIDEIKNEMMKPGYSTPLTVKFLKCNDKLVLDTRFFDTAFRTKLIGGIDTLDEQSDGLLIHSENFQALNLLQERYRAQVKCVYIDPPYNAAATEIFYKNGYKSSSWCSLIHERLIGARKYLTESGILCVTIDDYELYNLKKLGDLAFSSENYLSTVLIRNNPSGRSTVSGFAICHEYALFYANKIENCLVGRLPHSDEQKSRYDLVDKDGKPFEWENFRKSSAGSYRNDRPKQYFAIYLNENNNKLRIPECEWNDQKKEWVSLEQPLENEVTILPIDSQGRQRVWNFGVERTRATLDEMKVEIRDGKPEVYKKKYLQQQGILPRTWWEKPEYSARDSGTRALSNLFAGQKNFDFPKAVVAVKDALLVGALSEADTVLDFFAGSGTTGHAVIDLNREDDLQRRFILVEMGDYFDTVLKPRIVKVVYSDFWKDGKPAARNAGVSHCCKYLRLESYEDTLNNLVLKRTPAQLSLLADTPSLKEEYMLSYMMDLEAEGSASLLNVDTFADPWNYTLKIATDSAGETRTRPVDLVETFNYLLGLTVVRRIVIRGIEVVEGTNPEGEKVLIIWRNTIKVSNEQLNEFFRKQNFKPREGEFDFIYVNGDNNLENFKLPDETWKVRLTEEEFKRLMFDVEDV